MHLRKKFKETNGKMKIFSFGFGLDYLSFPVLNIGNSVKNLKLFFEAKSFFSTYQFNKKYALLNYKPKDNKKVKILVGGAIHYRKDSKAIISMIKDFSSIANKINKLKIVINIGHIALNVGNIVAAELNIKPYPINLNKKI